METHAVDVVNVVATMRDSVARPLTVRELEEGLRRVGLDPHVTFVRPC